MNKFDLKNKVALVTGGAQGFGLAIVERLLQSEAEVIIWDNDEKELNNLKLSGKVHKLLVDVTDFDNVQKSTNETKKFYLHLLFPLHMQTLLDFLL